MALHLGGIIIGHVSLIGGSSSCSSSLTCLTDGLLLWGLSHYNWDSKLIRLNEMLRTWAPPARIRAYLFFILLFRGLSIPNNILSRFLDLFLVWALFLAGSAHCFHRLAPRCHTSSAAPLARNTYEVRSVYHRVYHWSYIRRGSCCSTCMKECLNKLPRISVFLSLRCCFSLCSCLSFYSTLVLHWVKCALI